MKNFGKMKLFALSGLFALIIISLITFILVNPESRPVIGLFFGIVALMSGFSVFIAFRGVKKIEKMIENLSKEYKDVYVNANEIVAMSFMNKASKKETMDMILEIFTAAQNEGRSVESVIGNDLGSFMKGFIEVSGGKTNFLYLFSYSTFIYVIYLFAMKAYLVIRNGDMGLNSLKEYQLDLGTIIAYGLIAYLFFPLYISVIKKASTDRWKGGKKILVLIPFLIPFALFAMLIFVKNDWFVRMVDIDIPVFNNPFSIIVGIVIVFVARYGMKYARKIQLRKNIEF